MVPIAAAAPEARAGRKVTSEGSGSGLVTARVCRSGRADVRRRHGHVFRRSFAPRPSSAPMLRVALTRYLTANLIDDRTVPKIVLCADEALINAVQHAADSPIGVAAEVRGERLVLEVVDGGSGFDPSDLGDDPLPDLMGEHGRGLFLIRQLMDDLEILSDDRGATLRMALDLGAG